MTDSTKKAATSPSRLMGSQVDQPNSFVLFSSSKGHRFHPYQREEDDTRKSPELVLAYDSGSEELSKELEYVHANGDGSESEREEEMDENGTEPLDEEELNEMKDSLLQLEAIVNQSNKSGNIASGFDDDPEELQREMQLFKKNAMSSESVPLPRAPKKIIDLTSASGEYEDAWDNAHVKLPCSPQNSYRKVADLNTPLPKWELIKESLLGQINNTRDLEEAIMSYNPTFQGKWSFGGIHTLINKVFTEDEKSKFINETLPAMISIALELPDLCLRPIPLLAKTMDAEIMLTQRQVASLLANAFFCTFPRRSLRKGEYENYPNINFNTLFSLPMESAKQGKLRCIIHYFERLAKKIPEGNISFHRQVLDEFPAWERCRHQLPKLTVHHEGTIEDDGLGCIQVDFANKFIGGGVLEELDANECLFIIGSERFCNYTGYRSSFAFSGDYVDNTARDSKKRIKTVISGIDAINLRNPSSQYRSELVTRELNKAFCGFHLPGDDTSMTIATGNWGCGAFGGHRELKSIIQLLAAAVLGRPVLYFTFSEEDFAEDLSEMYELLTFKKRNVGEIINLLRDYHALVVASSPSSSNRKGLFTFLRERMP